MNLSDLLPDVPSMTHDELAALAARIPASELPAILTAQMQVAGSAELQFVSLIGGDYLMCCDVLKDMGTTYPAEVGDAIVGIAENCPVVSWTEAIRDQSVTRRTPFTDPGSPEPWVQPFGAHDAYALADTVSHEGFNYYSLVNANVWEPSPQSTLWSIFPDPGPLPWVQPTGSSNAYDVGDVVTHIVAGRDETIWQSNIPANTTEPGTDGTFDRWWMPLDAVPPVGPQPWRQPLPGAWPAYSVGTQVTHSGSTWACTFEQNVWEPGVFGWEQEGAPAAAPLPSGKS